MKNGSEKNVEEPIKGALKLAKTHLAAKNTVARKTLPYVIISVCQSIQVSFKYIPVFGALAPCTID